MSREAVSRDAPWIVDGCHVLPVLHERLEFAHLAARAVERIRPDAVVVEIPSSLERAWRRGVERLPSVSVLLFENAAGRTIYLPIHPADPLTEAARSAAERGIELVCGDLDVDGYADYRDAAPDAYALLRLGLPRFYERVEARQRATDPLDDRRERSMAYHARRLRAEGASRVLLLCGMHHAARIAALLESEQAVPLTPPERSTVRLVHLDPESIGEVLPEIPFYVAAYEMARHGAEALPALPPDEPPVEPWRRHGPFRVLSGGRRDVTATDALSRCVHGALTEGALDRLKLQWRLVREAERRLAAATPDEEVRRWQRVNLARFSRNLSLASGRLIADLFDLLSAARACVSDNFAWELHRLAVAYPYQGARAADLPTAKIRAEEMYEGTRRIRLQRRTRRPKRPDWRTVLRRGRKHERWSGEWLEGFDGEAICSYPPEDIVVEDFGRYLRRRGKTVLSEERARSVPFTTSVLDGIDVRETIRHWSEKKIFVRELGRSPGDVGSVVIVFDEDEERYPHCQTWLGEHDQESDMAFYCTDPGEGIVGPGICRATYGGFLLSYPPRRMADVWTDADYRLAESKAETLLLAGLDYCTERVLCHVAARPPRSILHQLAGRLGLKILHLPLGTLSPSTIRRIRVMHILSGHDKRAIARDYVW